MMVKVDLVGMVDMIDMVDSMVMVDNLKWWTIWNGGQYRHGEWAEDFWLLEVAKIYFRMDKDDLIGMLDIVDHMAMVWWTAK